MLLSVFPEWVKKQYKLDEHAQNGFVNLRMEHAVWGLPQSGILANNSSGNGSLHMDIMSASTLPAFGNTNGDPSRSPLSWMILE
jgi:hypothetical protein